MKMEHASGRRGYQSSSVLMRALAAVIAAAWVAGWFAFLKPRPVVSMTRAGPPTASRLYFWSQDKQWGKTAAAVQMWLPILFSLPSPAGFSTMVPQPRTGTSVPLMSDLLSPSLMDQSSLTPAVPALSTRSQANGALVTFALLRPSWHYHGGKVQEKGAGIEAPLLRPQARPLEPGSEAGAELLDLPTDLPSPASGRITLYLICDQDGLVTHVLPEEADADYRGLSRLVAAAARWKLRPSDAPRQLRVIVDWLPASGD